MDSRPPDSIPDRGLLRFGAFGHLAVVAAEGGPLGMMIDLRSQRLNRGLSISGASKEIGVTRDTLRRAEEGGPRPHPRNAFKIASFYGYRVTDIWPVEDPEDVAA